MQSNVKNEAREETKISDAILNQGNKNVTFNEIRNLGKHLSEKEQLATLDCFLEYARPDDKKLLLGEKDFLEKYLNLAMKRGRFESAINILKEAADARDPVFLALWDEAHYRWHEAFTPIQKFRIRRRYPPPASVCPGGVRPSSRMGQDSKNALTCWLQEHRDIPYPTQSQKKQLSAATGLTLKQVTMWFGNARRRMKQLKRKQKCEGAAMPEPTEKCSFVDVEKDSMQALESLKDLCIRVSRETVSPIDAAIIMVKDMHDDNTDMREQYEDDEEEGKLDEVYMGHIPHTTTRDVNDLNEDHEGTVQVQCAEVEIGTSVESHTLNFGVAPLCRNFWPTSKKLLHGVEKFSFETGEPSLQTGLLDYGRKPVGFGNQANIQDVAVLGNHTAVGELVKTEVHIKQYGQSHLQNPQHGTEKSCYHGNSAKLQEHGESCSLKMTPGRNDYGTVLGEAIQGLLNLSSPHGLETNAEAVWSPLAVSKLP